MASRRTSLPRASLPPGLLIGLLLGLVQSLLVALVPVDPTPLFYVLVGLILLLYLLVPFFARLYALRNGVQQSGSGCGIGLTCATLVILTPIIVFFISAPGVSVGESGGFYNLRLAGDLFFALVTLILFNAAGLILAVIGGWLGGRVGARWARAAKEQEE